MATRNRAIPNSIRSMTSKQSYRTSFTNNNIEVDMAGCLIKLPRLGWVPFRKNKKQTRFPSEIVNATIRMTPTGKYFVSVLCNTEVQELPEVSAVVGGDMGLKQFLIPSHGEPIENPRYFRKAEKQLARAQRRLSRMKKGSKKVHQTKD